MTLSRQHKSHLLTALSAAFLLAGCSSLLPSAKQITKSPWSSFNEVKIVYDRVIPETTTTRELRALGFDIYSSPNVKIQNYVEIAVSTLALKGSALDVGLQKCIDAKIGCQGYEFQPRFLASNRYGNFWMDLFKFKRKTREKGWAFRALFLIENDTVIYKLWSGSPIINEEKETRNPLGPLQEAGDMLIQVVR